MQAIALILNDDFLLSYNLSIDVSDVIDYIRNLTWKWAKKDSGIYQEADFDDYFGINFAEIIGPYGFCYTFNIIDAEDLFHLEKYFI